MKNSNNPDNRRNNGSGNRGSRSADKEKIRILLETDPERIQAAADRIAPDFDYAREEAMLEAGDRRADTLKAEREEAMRKISELLEAEYDRLQAAADRIASDFDYESEARAIEAEDEAEIAEAERAALAESCEERADQQPQHEAAAPSGADQDNSEPVDFEWKEDLEREEAEKKRREEEEAKEKARQERIEALMAKPLPPAEVSPSKYPKPARQLRTGAGRRIFASRHTAVFAASVLLIAIFAGYQAWDYLVPKTVDISYAAFDGVREIEYKTRARDVSSLMEELTEAGRDSGPDAAGISVSKHDLTDLDGSCRVTDGMPLNITHASKAGAKIAGKKKTLWLIPGTIEENLALNGIEYDEDDEISPAPGESADADTSIVVDEVHYDVKDKHEKIESVSKVILDPSLTSGVQEQTEGNDGEGIFTYTTRYVNGRKDGTEKDFKEWVIEPHDAVLRLGTANTGNSGEYVIARTFTANTTAYSARPGARGALGMPVHVGTCAVDPRFVSLRSELWVEGYGYAYAMDTGGAVKGNVVDLYMSSNGQCIQWGRRNKLAYVLQPAG